MTVNPAIRVGPTLRGLLIDTAQSFGNNAKTLLFLEPNVPIGLVHHFSGTDRAVLTQAWLIL